MNRGFKFKERWLLKEDCGNVVEEAWGRTDGAASPMVDVSSKIIHCRAVLEAWGLTRTKPEVRKLRG